MENSAPTPRHMAAQIGMLRVNRRLSVLASNDKRRQHAAKNGYRGPLTRAEYAAQARRSTGKS